MTAKPPISTTELIVEVAREVLATLLVLALVIPWLIIQAVARISSMIIKRRGGID